MPMCLHDASNIACMHVHVIHWLWAYAALSPCINNLCPTDVWDSGGNTGPGYNAYGRSVEDLRYATIEAAKVRLIMVFMMMIILVICAYSRRRPDTVASAKERKTCKLPGSISNTPGYKHDGNSA